MDQDWQEMERLWDEHGPAIDRYNFLLRRWERAVRTRATLDRARERREGS